MNNRQLAAVPHRLQWLQGGMQRKPAIEIETAVRLARLRDGDARTQLVVPRLEERHDDVQAVGRAPLEDGDQDLAAAFPLRGGAQQPLRRGAGGAKGDRGRTEKRHVESTSLPPLKVRGREYDGRNARR